MVDFKRMRQGSKEQMATTRPRATSNELPDDDLPNELNGDSVPQGSSAAIPQQSRETAEGMDLDALGAMGFNNERDALERAKLNPPTGDWIKSDRWEMKSIVYVGDSMPGDIDPRGRTMFTFTGKPDARVDMKSGVEHQPVLFLRCSPDIRYKAEKPTEVDTAYKIFNKAKEDVYVELYKERPTTFKQLLTMLEHDAYVIRTMSGDNGLVCLDVKAKVARRR